MAKNPMTREELVAHFAKKFKVSKASTDRWFDELARVAARDARKGFKIPGVGKLVVVKRKARKGRNFHTKELMKIPAKTYCSSGLEKPAMKLFLEKGN